MDIVWTISYVSALIAAYLLGSIPFGLLIGFAKGVDIRQHGSKNIGSANVGRTLGRRFGVLTFFLDAAKGFLPVFLGGWALGYLGTPDLPANKTFAWIGFGAASFIGHLYPVFLRFKGGKGVATGFGALLAVFPVLTFPAVGAIIIWALSVKFTRFVGFSSCLASLSLPILTLLATPLANALGVFREMPRNPSGWAPWSVLWPYFTMSMALAILVVWRHRTNLARMLQGTEPRVGEKKPSPQPPTPDAGTPDSPATTHSESNPVSAARQ